MGAGQLRATVVPPRSLRCSSAEPPTLVIRSTMELRHPPPRDIASSVVKPGPESAISTRTAPFSDRMLTAASARVQCLITLRTHSRAAFPMAVAGSKGMRSPVPLHVIRQGSSSRIWRRYPPMGSLRAHFSS